MFEDLDGLDAPGALAEAVALRQTADRAEAQLLWLAAHWADLHAVLPGQGDGVGARVVVPGMERLLRLAGPGTPEVAEFAPAELGAALGMSTFAASCLVGDALELRHRLPRLWGRVLDGTLAAWRARRVADHTKILSAQAAAWVDAQVVPVAHKVGMKRVLDLVAAALMRFDPEQAARRARAAQDGRGVFLGEETVEGTRSIRIEADALDAAEFDATIAGIAAALAGLGDPDREQVRRAKAVGVIADPQGALDLLDATGDSAGEAVGGEHAGEAVGGAHGPDAGAGVASGAGAGRRRGGGWRPGGRPVLYIHLHADAVAGHGAGALARVEGAGPVTVGQVMAWLGRTDMRIQPVLDLADTVSVDAYEAPARIRETVVLRNPCCPFPWCTNLSRRKDLDHVTPYLPPEEGGPPGQTGPDNLAAPCRRHHRLKTHGGWSYTMPEPGIYLWRSPHGRRYLVDHTGTTNLSTAAA